MEDNNDENPNHYGHDEDGNNLFVDGQPSLSDITHGSASSASSASSQPKKKKVKVEEEPASSNHGALPSLDGDHNLVALGSMGLHPHPAAFNQNFNLALGTGLPMAGFAGSSAMQMGAFPGTSPGFYPAMGHTASHHLFGFGPGFAMAHRPMTENPAGSNTPDAHSNEVEEGGEGGRGGSGQPERLSGMTPIMFAPAAGDMPVNNPMAARAAPAIASHPAVLPAVSSDSQMENGGAATSHQLAMMPFGNFIPLQPPKKWVRWSDQEDQALRRSVEQWGDNNFRYISEQVFYGTRTEAQCKNRWKKALQPGLIKGRWTKEEDRIITDFVAAGNTKWSDIARHIPGRIGEQVKERWVNVLDPNVKRGLWTEAEMRTLRESQKELGNKWSEIAKRIPGRSENSVKNRWYNQKTSDRRAQEKRKEQASFEKSLQQQNDEVSHKGDVADQDGGPMMHNPPQILEQDDDQHELYEHELEDEYKNSPDEADLAMFGEHHV